MNKYCIWGGPPRCNIFSHFLHTFCLLLNLFWTFHLKPIGFLRFRLIFHWFFNDFASFSAYFLGSLLTLPIIFVYYSPGDKAQKVIPGGSKTNESFWKSRNNVKKIILRFPPFVFTTALVIERKKLSPEARKQTRASESLKITSKNQFYVTHHFCLPHYYALFHTITHYYALLRIILRTIEHYYALLRTITHYYALLRTIPHYYGLLRTITYYYALWRTITHYYILLRTNFATKAFHSHVSNVTM